MYFYFILLFKFLDILKQQGVLFDILQILISQEHMSFKTYIYIYLYIGQSCEIQTKFKLDNLELRQGNYIKMGH